MKSSAKPLKLPAHGYGLDLAVAKSMLGKKDDAFQSLNTARTEDAVNVITWIRRPEFDSLRSDARNAALMRRMSLAEWADPNGVD